MKKKFLSTLLIGSMLVLTFGCAKNNQTDNEGTTSQQETDNSQDDVEETTEEETTPEPTEETSETEPQETTEAVVAIEYTIPDGWVYTVNTTGDTFKGGEKLTTAPRNGDTCQTADYLYTYYN